MLRTAHPVASIPDVLSSKLRLNDKSSAEASPLADMRA